METTDTKWRIERFHLSRAQDAVVTSHPQAESEVALQQGYIVLRFEAGVSDAFKNATVAALNAAGLEARHTWGIDASMERYTAFPRV